MKFSTQQQIVFDLLIGYLREDVKGKPSLIKKIENESVNLTFTLKWFMNETLLGDSDGMRRRLNQIREYYLDRLKKDIKK